MKRNEVPESIGEELGANASSYRKVAYDLRRWASGDDFLPLRSILLQSIALVVLFAFVGLTLSFSLSDRLALIGEWMIIGAPFAGLALFVRNFSHRRRD